MDTESVLDVIRRRRTIRHYTKQAVSDDQIRTLLTAGMSAPSMFNRRPWHFVVIRDPAIKATIAEQLRLNRSVVEAPVLIGVLANVGRSPHLATGSERRGRKYPAGSHRSGTGRSLDQRRRRDAFG